jgi:methylisocitrate lyase
MTVGAPPTILSYSEVCESVGFNKYWEREEKYKFQRFYERRMDRTGRSSRGCIYSNRF